MTEESLVRFEQKGTITIGVVHAASVLDAMNVNQFGESLLAHVKQHPGIKLLLDFSRVDYLSSAVLTELLKVDQACKETSGHLRLCSLNPDIRKVFEITNLDKHFVIYKDAERGVANFLRSLEVEASEEAWAKVNKRE